MTARQPPCATPATTATERAPDAGLIARVVLPGVHVHSLNECLREHALRRYSRQKRLCGRLAPFVNRALAGADLAGPLVVAFVRVAPRPHDGDNWPAGDCKALRDWIAREYLRRDDRESATLAWRYAQRRGRPHEHALEITFARGTP